MATIFDMELNDVEIDNATILNNPCTSSERQQIIDYEEFDHDESIVVENEIEVCFVLFMVIQKILTAKCIFYFVLD